MVRNAGPRGHEKSLPAEGIATPPEASADHRHDGLDGDALEQFRGLVGLAGPRAWTDEWHDCVDDLDHRIGVLAAEQRRSRVEDQLVGPAQPADELAEPLAGDSRHRA